MNPQTIIKSTVGAALAWLLLALSVQAGMSVPSHELVSGIEDSSSLDYSALPKSLTPLSPDYIAQILGGDVPFSSGGAAANAVAAVAAGGTGGPAPAVPVLPGVAAVDTTGGERTVVEHELTNDDFDDAYPIPSVPFTARTNSSDATREQGEPSDCAPAGGTLWYRFSVARAVGLVASTVSNRPASVQIYSGREITKLHLLDCDTDVTGRASVAFPAEKKTSYYVQVTAPGGGGPIVFSLDPLGVTEQVSIAPDKAEIDDRNSIAPSLSADGRFVAFMSWAKHLVPGDTNDKSDVFVYDRVTDRTELVSVNSKEQQGDGHSGDQQSAISADGRYVAFFSDATNLVPRDGNGFTDAFVRDRVKGTTTRVSVTSSGQELKCLPLCDPFWPAVENCSTECTHHRGITITPDGRFVAFEYVAGLDERYPRGSPARRAQEHLYGSYVHDRKRHTTELVSVNNRGKPARGTGSILVDFPAISADGRFVAFRSDAANLVCRRGRCDGDNGQNTDVFVHDRRTHRTELVSVDSAGNQQDGDSFLPAISADGRYVAFASWANNLSPAESVFVADRFDVDYFVHDRKTGRTEMVSVNSAGEQQDAGGANGNDGGGHEQLLPAISANGRYVAFSSTANNLADDGGNGVRDIFLHDRVTGITTLVSVDSAGDPGSAASSFPALSANARFVAYNSKHEFVADDDDFPDEDVFVHSLPFL